MSMADESKIKVGVRVRVINQTGQLVGLGQVAYFGETEFKSGKWVGVILDDPKGKNNGIVQGKQYFSCADNYGIFVNPDRITILDETTSANKPRVSAAQSSEATGKTSAVVQQQSDKSVVDESLPAAAAPSKTESNLPTAAQSQVPTPGPLPPTQEHTTTAGALADANATQQRLNDALAQIQDLEEKLETLRVKRAEDRDKLKELEKQRLQNQQLSEYKLKMQENFASVQSELFDTQKRLRELQEEYDRYREDNREAHDVQEILSMDKELAEEKLELLQTEHSELLEAHEALLKENEALKHDLERMARSSAGQASESDANADDTVKGFQLRQLAEQNAKLKEACVKLRDISQEEKREAERLQKLLDKQTTELGFLQKEKERANADLAAAQRQIIDLHEQLDASLGSDRLVVELSEKSATLEDRVQQLSDENAQLESLCDANDELLEVEREKQQELRDELDRMFVEKFEMKRRTDALAESLAECARTIQQYKAIAIELQTKLSEAQAALAQAQPDPNGSQSQSVATSVTQPVTSAPQSLDFHARFIELQAFAKSIEIELRKIELENSNRHVQLLLAYLPDDFLRNGGEHDAMQVCLLVPRLASKAHLLAEQVRSSFLGAQSDGELAPDADLAQLRRVSFTHVLICELQLLAGVLHQFDAALAACTVEQYIRVGALYVELTAHESTTVDYLLDLLRKDRLDETVSLDGLHKVVNYFVDLYRIQLFGVDTHINGLAELDAFIRAASPALDGIELDAQQLRSVLGERSSVERELLDTTTTAEIDETSADSLLAFINDRSFELRDCLKRIRRYALQMGDVQTAQLAFPKETAALLQDAVCELALLVSALHLGVVEASRHTELDVERTGHIPELAVRKFLAEAIESVYGSQTGASISSQVNTFAALSKPRAALERSLQSVRTVVTALENGEFDADATGLSSDRRNSTQQSKASRPRLNAAQLNKTPAFLVRAQAFKKGVQAADELKRKLETLENEAKEAKLLVSRKQQECEEMKLRVELAEKKFENAQKSIGEKDFWKQLATEREDQLRKHKEDTDTTLNQLQKDLNAAETENRDLKEKIKQLSKRSLLENIANVRASSPMPAPVAQPAQAALAQGKAHDSPMLLQHIEALQSIIQQLRQENMALSASRMKEQLGALKPLKASTRQFVPGRFSLTADGIMTDDEKRDASCKPEPYAHYAALNDTFKSLGELNHRWLSFCVDAKAIDLSASKAPSAWRCVLQRKLAEKEIVQECEKMSHEAVRLLAQVRFGCTVQSDLREFPSSAFTGYLQKRLLSHQQLESENANGRVVEVTNEQLEALHNRLLKFADVV